MIFNQRLFSQSTSCRSCSQDGATLCWQPSVKMQKSHERHWGLALGDKLESLKRSQGIVLLRRRQVSFLEMLVPWVDHQGHLWSRASLRLWDELHVLWKALGSLKDHTWVPETWPWLSFTLLDIGLLWSDCDCARVFPSCNGKYLTYCFFLILQKPTSMKPYIF